MLYICIDTNVFLDLLFDVRPDHQDAVKVFKLFFSRQAEAVLSIQSIIDASYISRKYRGFDRASFNKAVNALLSRINVTAIDRFELSEAMLEKVCPSAQ